MKKLYFSNLAYAKRNRKKFDNIYIIDRFRNTHPCFNEERFKVITPLIQKGPSIRLLLDNEISNDQYQLEYIKRFSESREMYEELQCIVHGTSELGEKNLIVTNNFRHSVAPIIKRIINLYFPDWDVDFEDYGEMK